jgi:hypothetical protein
VILTSSIVICNQSLLHHHFLVLGILTTLSAHLEISEVSVSFDPPATSWLRMLKTKVMAMTSPTATTRALWGRTRWDYPSSLKPFILASWFLKLTSFTRRICRKQASSKSTPCFLREEFYVKEMYLICFLRRVCKFWKSFIRKHALVSLLSVTLTLEGERNVKMSPPIWTQNL